MSEGVATELYLYISNDGKLYREVAQPIMQNYAVKHVRGVYDSQKAVIGWVHLVDEGWKKYKKEVGGYHNPLDKATKIRAAKALGNHYEEEIQIRVKKLIAAKKAGKPKGK